MRVLLLAFALSVSLSAQAPIGLYIQAGDPNAPFVDPALKDSANDLAGDLRGKLAFRIVSKIEDAKVVLRLLTRGRHTGAGVAIIQAAPNVAFAVPSEKHAIIAVLMVGYFRHDLSGVADGSWRGASKDLAKQVERWMNENQERLRR